MLQIMNDILWEGIKRHIKPLGGFEQAVLLEVKPGYARFSIGIPQESLNLYGIVHGGFLFTLCDMAAGIASYAYGMTNTTLQGSINFLKAASLEDKTLYVECHSAHKGRSTVVNQVEIRTEDGKQIAIGTFTMFLLKLVEGAEKPAGM